MSKVTRFAPSPTGNIHIGNLRTALFNYLVAKQNDGTFILRIDDTDAERSKEEYVDGIQRDLEWLGIEWDRMERQSTRYDRYYAARDELIEKKRLYEGFETPTELDLKRKKQLNMGKPPVYDRASLLYTNDEKEKLRKERGSYWRFLLDQERIEWTDGILGDISIDAASVSDPVLIRADGQLLYTLASVVDDIDFGITDVVRGSDHVTNTATQIQIIDALGAKPPRFAHHSLLTGPQGEALSKRLGSLSIKDFRENGVEPMALLSLMARLGSSQPVEIASNIDEIAAGFDLSSFGASPTKFDPDDVYKLSTQILRGLPETAVDSELSIVPESERSAFWAAIHENVETRADIARYWAIANGDYETIIADEDKEFIAEAKSMLPPQPWDETTWKSWTGAVKAATGRSGKSLFMPLRKALTGMDHGPDMSKFMPFLKNRA